MSRFRTPLLLCAAGLVTLSACVDPNNPQPERNRTVEGAAVGGFLGAIVGAAAGSNHRLTHTVIGAGVGAVVGGAIGSSLDQQAKDLAAAMDSRVKIVNTGSELVVTMPEDILFEVDSTYVGPTLRDDLNTLAASLLDYPDTTVDVIGHTDNTGTAAYNQDLSARRARAVGDILTGAGVSAGRVRTFGRGEDEPIASNLSEDGRHQNRRVEIIIRPNT